MIIELFTRPRCHLCDDAKRVLQAAALRFDFRLIEKNVEDNAQWEFEFGEDIPVIFVNGRKAFKHRVSLAQVEKYLSRVAPSEA